MIVDLQIFCGLSHLTLSQNPGKLMEKWKEKKKKNLNDFLLYLTSLNSPFTRKGTLRAYDLPENSQ